MSPSSPLVMGMDVHQDAIAVADVAQDHGAEVRDLGAIGTRPGDRDPLIRQRPSTATHLSCVDAAGPCGDGLSRYLTQKGADCWVVAPSWIPKEAGDRVNTDRRDAVQLARWARSGALTAVDVPTVDADARRALSRAREEASSDRTDAKGRLHAVVLRQESRAVGCPTPAQPLVCHADVRAVHAQTARLQRLEPARHDHGNA